MVQVAHSNTGIILKLVIIHYENKSARAFSKKNNTGY